MFENGNGEHEENERNEEELISATNTLMIQ
jgi:hypothetical protein